MSYLTEACQPYDSRHAEPPSHITDIIDRLDHYELRRLAVILSAVSPAAFEEELLAIWEQRTR